MVDDKKTKDKNPSELDGQEDSLVEGLPPYKSSGGTESLLAEDMNSTMMGIDLNAFQAETRQNIKVDLSVSEKQSVSKSVVAKKPSFLERLMPGKNKVPVFKSSEEKTPHDFKFPKSLNDYNSKIFFYVLRFLILILSLWSYFVLGKTLIGNHLQGHPARWIFSTAVILAIVLSIVALLRRAHVTWFVTLPFTALAFVLAYGAWFYGTSDGTYFLFQQKSSAAFLNVYYLLVFGLLLILFLNGQTRTLAGKILWGILCVLSLAAPLLNLLYGIDFEEGLVGFGALAKIDQFYLKPAYLFLHAIIPLWLILSLVKSLSGDPDPRKKQIRAVHLSFVPLFLVLIFLGLALLQSNRIFHVGNFLIPMKSGIGAAEFSLMGHHVHMQTRTSGKKMASTDSRFTFKINTTPNPKQFDVQVLDANKKPVYGIDKKSLKVLIDGVENQDFQFLPHPTNSNLYLFKLDLKAKDQAISFATTKKAWTQSEELVLEVADPLQISKVVLMENGQNLIEKSPPFAEKLNLTLAYFNPGDHNVAVVAYDAKNQELARLPLKFNIQESRDFFMVAPFEGDEVAEQISVLLSLKLLKPQEIKKVTYRLNGTTVLEIPTFTSFVTLSAKGVVDGSVKLQVQIDYEGGSLNHETSLQKTSKSIANLNVLSPLQGSFAQNETQVVYEIAEPVSAKVLGVRVKVNGMPFEDFEVKENRFLLPLSRWKGSEVYIALQATLDSGQKVSDWVQVNRGVSAIKLQFQTQSLGFLGQKSMAVLMDGSESSLDFWYAKSQWDIFKDALLSPEIQNKLSEQTLDLYIAGADKPAYFNNCETVQTAFNGEVTKVALKKKLDELTPQGQRPLLKGTTQALKNKPDKLFVLTSGFDSCEANSLERFAELIAKNTSSKVNLFWLGESLSDSEVKVLTEALQKSGGDFFDPEDSESFLKSFSDSLSVNFELYESGKLLQRAPLKDLELNLPPGDYTLRLPFTEGFKDVPLHLDHGLKKVLNISGKAGKIFIEESSIPL